jgi:hypothetical protein
MSSEPEIKSAVEPRGQEQGRLDLLLLLHLYFRLATLGKVQLFASFLGDVHNYLPVLTACHMVIHCQHH